ncbi:MAG: NAD(P)-dependent oxidoreductase [Candidatus Eremiobacteraeota bacterium]|nr:NAD(P)-dependent oxidoreductase [Candidatus Eremiobacteraeota bacterium]
MSEPTKTVLVTGAAGYIGSTLSRLLVERGYLVRGLDILTFGGGSLDTLQGHPAFSLVKGDIRNEADLEIALEDCGAVVHLAAIVGDPACAKNPDLARETNWEASRRLFDLCLSKDHVKRFLFASTCSNYGKMEGEGFVHEDSPLRPVSLYAELKVKFEEYILGAPARADFIPTSLRFATVYGLSHRMRFDLTVNEFVKDAFLNRELVIYGEQFWRPYCHVSDIARACLLVLVSDGEKVRRQVFGVGDTGENYQKKMLADEILKVLPDTAVKYVHKAEDPRDYRVDFSRIRDTLGFTITKTVPGGIMEVYEALRDKRIQDPNDRRYYNS